MLYFANPCSEATREAMRAGLIGAIHTPGQWNRLDDGVQWCADNGCFSDRWNAEKWWKWLERKPRTMKFAVCPDVVGDWTATRSLFAEWAPKMSAAGYPVACVAQDGADEASIPWEEIAAVFIGGSTEWKLGAESERIIACANRRGVWAHVGRVNSMRRLRWADDVGADSADGTFLTFAPDQNLPKLLAWLRQLNEVPTLDLWRNAA